MTLAINHNFVSPVADEGDPNKVGSDEWNAAHDITMAGERLLGKADAGAGAATELTAAQVRTLINVEDGATADQTAAEILAALLTVDGAGSGLDADLLDGQEASAFAAASHAHAASDITSGTLAHERGGLEADVSAYAGFPYISGGATSQVAAGIGNGNVLLARNTPNSGEVARFTADGIEGLTEAEFKAAFNLEAGTDFLSPSTLAATTNGNGASLIGIEDSAGRIAATTVEGALAEIAEDVAALDAAVILKGSWDASAGSFPGAGAAQAGWSYIVSVGGTVDSVVFVANDRIVAITDNASTSTYAANWHKLDYTDQVLSVDGQTGAVDLSAVYQPLDADLTSWAGVTRASGFDTFAATPSSANLKSLVTDETGSGGALVFATSPAIATPTLTDPIITGAILEDIFTITDAAGFEIDPSNGSLQRVVLGASRTPAATNFANGESVTLMVDDGTAFTITWTTVGVVWVGGSAPALETSGFTIIELWKEGNVIRGALVGGTAS